jgi:glucan phosphoethanolaminetransferase (alkaline phosphatase superfamily)
MKSNLKIVLISAHLILAAYLLIFCFCPGYITPFLNNPIGRLIVIVAISLFILQSVVLVFLVKQNTFLYKLALCIHVFVLLIPNILLPVLGPATIAIFATGCSL